MRRATCGTGKRRKLGIISTHALHAESDGFAQIHQKAISISTHALHAESDNFRGWSEKPMIISTHALHAESDIIFSHFDILLLIISTHALHAESDGLAFARS